MKKLLSVLLTSILLLGLCCPAVHADGMAGTIILAEQGAGNYLLCCMAPNGKPVYFSAALPDPLAYLEDVNFDGFEDLVILTASGASNAYFEFFVYDPATDEYCYADHPGIDYGLCNYVLYPEYGIVATHANNGSAGAEHEDCLFRWNGTNLEKIRSAVSEQLVVTEFTEETYTATTYFEFISMTVRNHELGNCDDSVVWEQEISIVEAVERNIFAQEQEILWQGIK